MDLMFFFGGLVAAVNGVPAISEFFPNDVVKFFAYLFSCAALICLAGVSFPRLWAFEILGKSILLGLMTAYLVSLLFLTAGNVGNRGFVLFVTAATILPIVWKLSILGSEWQARRLIDSNNKSKDEEV